MTDIHHAGDDAEEVSLEDVVGDVDPADLEIADEMLEGLLGQGASERDDVPTKSSAPPEDDEEQIEEPSRNETVAGRWTCRFCETSKRSTASEKPHHEMCAPSQRHRKRMAFLADQDDSEDDEEIDEPGHEEPDRESRYLVKPQWHEFAAYLKYGDYGLDPYYALHQLRTRTDWHDGKREFELGFDGRTYSGEFWFSDSGFEPWDDDGFRIEKVREYHIKLRGPDDTRKAYFRFSPRWPDMETKEGASDASNPRDMVGLDVETRGSNHDPRQYPELLEAAADALGVNGASKQYYAPRRVKPWSVITDGELYVRIQQALSGKLIAIQGPIERMGLLLAEDRNGFRMHKADDRECAGYYHVAVFGSMRAGRIVEGHRLGKEVKHYHMRNPSAQTGSTKHPKLGVSFQRSTSEESVYWGDRNALIRDDIVADNALCLDDMERELDEVLLNTLRWAGLPTRPDHQLFVDDAIWSVEGDSRERALVSDPLPTLESEQEHMVTRALNRMVDVDRSDTDAKVIQELLADGGDLSPDDLADRAGVHYSTVLKSLKRLGDIVEHRYGSVAIKSHHIAQNLAERAGALLENFGRVQEGIDRVGRELANVVDGLDAHGESAFERWAAQYLDGVDDPEDDARLVLRMGYRPADGRELRSILKDGFRALIDSVGGPTAFKSLIARRGLVEATNVDGQSMTMPFRAPG